MAGSGILLGVGNGGELTSDEELFGRAQEFIDEAKADESEEDMPDSRPESQGSEEETLKGNARPKRVMNQRKEGPHRSVAAQSETGSKKLQDQRTTPNENTPPPKRRISGCYTRQAFSFIKSADQTVLGISAGDTANKLGLITFSPPSLHLTPAPGTTIPPEITSLLPTLAVIHGVSSIVGGVALILENDDKDYSGYSRNEKMIIGTLQAVSGAILAGTGFGVLLNGASATFSSLYLPYGINACVEFGLALEHYVRMRNLYSSQPQQKRDEALVDLAAKTCAFVGWTLLWALHPAGWLSLAAMALVNALVYAPVCAHGLFKVSQPHSAGQNVSPNNHHKAKQR